MRVWIHGENKWGEFGARRWVAEWWTLRPEAVARMASAAKDSADADLDPDGDTVCHTRAFKTRDAAANYAQMIVDADKDAFGEASIIEQIVGWFVEEDRVAEWQDVGEPEYFNSVTT